jgi:ribosomal protein S18 acetylase RimI-like enzyme
MMLIDKKYRRLRIATQLLYQVMITLKDKGFERCSLAVRLHNAKAIALYKGYGFVATHSDADSLFMTLQL